MFLVATGRATSLSRRRRVAGSDVAFGWQFVEVTARVHPFVQHADDLDHAFLGDAIVENVNRSPDLRAFSRTACISDVEAADTGTKVRSLLGERPFGLSRDLAHRGDENSGVPLPAVGAPPLGACRKDVGKIDLRWASEPKPRHAALTRALRSRRRQPFEIPFEIGVIHLGEIAAIERIGASLDLRAEAFSLRLSSRPTLLEYAQRVADGFAGILVFAGFDDFSTNASCSAVRLIFRVGIWPRSSRLRIPLMAKIANVRERHSSAG